MRQNKLSASSIAAFKACGQRYRLSYVEGLRSDKDTDAQRQGTSWHGAMEAYGNAEGDHDAKLIAAVEYLNDRYAEVPSWKTAEEYGLEHVTLITCVAGYFWFFQNQPLAYLANELAFELPIHMPRTGLPISVDEVVRVGKIDHLVLFNGAVCVLERKSTSRAIDPQSDYWQRWSKDSQISMYALALRDLQTSGQLPDQVAIAAATSPRFGSVLVDVFHKPTIKPAMLTQAATAEFLTSKTYHGETFTVEAGTDPVTVRVNDVPAVVEPGKKGFAIRETTLMFSARLLSDIQERPDFYFARREIARTDAELRKFRKDLYVVYQSMKMSQQHGLFVENEAACRATFNCQFIPICYGPGADAVCDGKTTPQNFKRIFVDLTINGQDQEE